MLEHSAHYIDGQWQPSNGQDRIAVVNEICAAALTNYMTDR